MKNLEGFDATGPLIPPSERSQYSDIPRQMSCDEAVSHELHDSTVVADNTASEASEDIKIKVPRFASLSLVSG